MCCWRCAWKCICFGRNDCRNLQFCCPVHWISFREVVGRLPPSWLCEFVKPHLLLPKSVQAVLYWFRDFAHHPAGFVIFAQLAQLCIFIIFLMISVLMLVGSSKIAQTVPDTSQHLFKWFFWLSGCQFWMFRISDILLLLLNRCLCVFSWLCCHSGLSLHIMIDPLLFLFVAQGVCFYTVLSPKLLFGSQAVQCSTSSNAVYFQAVLALICLVTSLCGAVDRFTIFAGWKWRKVPFQSVEHFIMCWPCCWARCWMLKDMDNMEASYVFHVNDGTLDQQEQCKICVLTIRKLGIVMLTVQYDMVFSVSFM